MRFNIYKLPAPDTSTPASQTCTVGALSTERMAVKSRASGKPARGSYYGRVPMPSTSRRVSLLSVTIAPWTVLLCACAAHSGGPNQRLPKESVQASQKSTTTPRVIVTPSAAFTIDELFAQAEAVADAGNWVRAAELFDRVHALDPEGPRAVAALHRAGLAYDRVGWETPRWAEALERFRELLTVARAPHRQRDAARWARDAAPRALRLAAHLERWDLAEELSEAMRRWRNEPKPTEAILLLAVRAMDALQGGNPQGAAHLVDEGLALVETHRIDLLDRLPPDVAVLYYASGEVKRLQAKHVGFVPVPADFPAVLERRCQLLLDAERAYTQTMRARDAHWSALAGLRTAALYGTLHRDLMGISAPASASPSKQELFRGTMLLRYSVLLEKARTVLERTAAMLERTRAPAPLLSKVAEARRAVLVAQESEREGLARLPYTRQELNTALEALQGSAREAMAPTLRTVPSPPAAAD